MPSLRALVLRSNRPTSADPQTAPVGGWLGGWGDSDGKVAMAIIQPMSVMVIVMAMSGVRANRAQLMTCSFGVVFTLESIAVIAGVGTGAGTGVWMQTVQ